MEPITGWEQVPLARYRDHLCAQRLLPSRAPLREALEERFGRFSAAGVTTLAALWERLSTPARLSALAEETGVPTPYLTLLRREIGALAPKPVPLVDFTTISPETVQALAALGVRTSLAYRAAARASDGPCRTACRDADEAERLYALCGLTLVNGVGAAAAQTLYAAGYRTVAQIAAEQSAQLLDRMAEANARYGYYQAKLGEKDAQFVIDAAATYGCFCEA